MLAMTCIFFLLTLLIQKCIFTKDSSADIGHIETIQRALSCNTLEMEIEYDNMLAMCWMLDPVQKSNFSCMELVPLMVTQMR